MDSQLTTRQIADALQVSESSVKRWCDRGVIPTIRTAGGHRRIPLTAFMLYLERTNQEVAASLITKLSRQPDTTSEDSPEQDERLREQFRASLEAGDEERAREAMTAFLSREESIAALADDLIARTFAEIGRRWQCGDVEVYQERRSCGICSNVLNEIRRLMPKQFPGAPLAMAAAPEGDQYSLPTQIIDLVLRECGWTSMNLGSNLPLESIAVAVKTHRPKLLCLSISHIDDEATFVERYREFQASLPSGVCLVLGGRALTDTLRPQLQYTAFCDNMRQLSSLATAMKKTSQPTSEN